MKMDKEKDWIFTFGCGQEHAGHYVKIHGTYSEARAEMFRRYGDQWCWQYDADEYFSKEGPKEKELIDG